MSSNILNRSLIAVVLSLALATHAEAQSSVGVRANGMGGAFVGVADDGTAVYWNPAGLATGAFASVNFEYGETEPDGPGDPAKMSHSLVALSLPPVGLAYYRRGVFGERPLAPAVEAGQSREEVRSSVHAFTASTFAISLLQSVTEYVVVAATPKLVWGGESFKVDVDASAMLALSHVRVGVTGRNLTTPSFALEDGGPEDVEQATEVRVGGGWGSGWPGLSTVVVAVDGDVLTRPTLSGDRRDIAGGVETWWFKRRFGARGGMRTSTVGEARTVLTAGASAMFSGMYLEGFWAGGDAEERSWGLGLRYSF
jgi:hypothetical protein